MAYTTQVRGATATHEDHLPPPYYIEKWSKKKSLERYMRGQKKNSKYIEITEYLHTSNKIKAIGDMDKSTFHRTDTCNYVGENFLERTQTEYLINAAITSIYLKW